MPGRKSYSHKKTNRRKKSSPRRRKRSPRKKSSPRKKKRATRKQSIHHYRDPLEQLLGNEMRFNSVNPKRKIPREHYYPQDQLGVRPFHQFL